MKSLKFVRTLTACTLLTFSATSFATLEGGNFDRADIAMVDVIYGWACGVPWYTTPQGNSLLVYVSVQGGGSWLYGEYSLNNFWYGYRPDVSSAGYCGGYQYAGWSISGWFYQNAPTTISVYYKDAFAGGALTLLGSKTVTGPGSF